MNKPEEGLTTRTLDKILADINDRDTLNRYLEKLDTSASYSSFLDYFQSLEKVKALTPAQLQKASDIERTYCYHILNGTKTPGRDKIFRLCLAAGLNEDETRRALEAGEVPTFYAKNRRDAVIRFAIHTHLSVTDTNLLLEEYHMEVLQ